jgi:AraC-like DNA-binding protein
VIQAVPSVSEFEMQHGRERERDRYNAQNIAAAWKRGEPVLGEHAGLCDWFIPIVAGGRVRSLLITGPFDRARPSSDDLLERWRWLTGRQGHPADPEFAYFLSVSLSTLVLGADEFAKFQRLLVLLAALMSGEGSAEELLGEAEALRDQIEKKTRIVERTWDAARGMVDERTARRWASQHNAAELAWLGVTRFPSQVLVGLAVGKHAEADPVGNLLRFNAFQRACVELSRKVSSTLSGPIGDHGVMFLFAAAGSSQRRGQGVLDLADKARALARRFDLTLYIGVSSSERPTGLDQQYREALAAAESALSQGRKLAQGQPRGQRSSFTLMDLTRQLSSLIEESPAALGARFDQYLEALGQHCGYRLEPLRAYLEGCFARIADTLRERGLLDDKSLLHAFKSLEQAAQQARTAGELFAAYRAAVADASASVLTPVPARHDRSLRRAVDYIHQHYGEVLSLPIVSRVAGFAPNYFSRLFKQREGMTFERYVRQLRLERAKQLLSTTHLPMARVAELSGLGTRVNLARVFKLALGETPLEYRSHSGPMDKPFTVNV